MNETDFLTIGDNWYTAPVEHYWDYLNWDTGDDYGIPVSAPPVSGEEELIKAGETGVRESTGVSDIEQLIKAGETGTRTTVGAPPVSGQEQLIKTGETGARTRTTSGGGLSAIKSFTDAIGLTRPDDKSINPLMLAGLAGLIGMAGKGSAPAPTGYQGSIPKYTAQRQQIEYAPDPTRRPGSGGRQYFTPVEYVSKAEGGIIGMARGQYLNGATDGMADKLPATIEDKQPARLSHGEFVVPADVVSHLGNGNSNAGAERLYAMMERIRKARTGNPKQGKEISPNKFLPA